MLKRWTMLACLIVAGGMGAPPARAANAAAATRVNSQTSTLDVPTRGSPGFTELSGEKTGVRFTNTLSLEQIALNANWMNGAGVAAGDFDGDGWCDLYFCAINGTNALYRNLGGWRFEDITAAAGVGLPGLHSTGAIFADVDGDGDLDLLVATLGGGVHLLMNEGGGRFRDMTGESGLGSHAGSTSLAMADVDSDGDLDLYVANYGEIPIMRSGGRAEMKQVNGQWAVTGPYAQRLRFVDGRLEELGEPDVLYLNDGRGHFHALPWSSEFFLDEDGEPVPEPWDFGLSAQFRDINGDGVPDHYVCNDFQTPDRVWINDGHGRFRALPRLAMRKQSYSSMGVDFADLDGDGFPEFFVAEMLGRTHEQRMRQASSAPPVVPLPGRFDDRPQVGRNTLFRNRGDGTYAEVANFSGLAASDWSWQPVFLDVDLDGYEDLLVVNGMALDILDRDTLQKIQSLGKQTPEQSRTNVLLYPPLHATNVAYRNRGGFAFEEVSAPWRFDSPRISQGIALADLDNDGDLDVVINCLNEAPLLYRNDTATPRLVVRLKGLKPNSQAIGAKIRVVADSVPAQMREITCGGRYLSGDDTVRTFATGSPTNESTIEVTWRNGERSVVRGVRANHACVIEEPAAKRDSAPAISRKDADRPRASAGALLREVSEALEHRHHEEPFNDYARQPLLMKLLSQLGPGVAWMDLDGDGHDELLIGTGKGGAFGVYRLNAAGKMVRVETAGSWTAPDDIAGLAAWVSGDGRRGLLAGLANYESGSTNAVVRCTWEAANGTLRVAPVSEIAGEPSSTGPLAVADIDGDGGLDMFVGGRVIPGAYPSPAVSRIFRQDSGRLVLDAPNSRVLEGAGMVSGAVWSDLDADGFPELILACEWGPVRIFRNEHGRLSAWDATVTFDNQTSTLSQLAGWWNGVTTGDFDGDGRLDIVASNWGLNDMYQATPAHPLELYYGNISGSGRGDMIEAYFAPELNADVPRRSLSALGQAFPMLLERFPNHRAFGAATMTDLLRLVPGHADKVTAATLASTLFLNRETRFVAVPLPAEAQFAPAFSVNVADVDGDGLEDLFISQNFFAVRPEVPRSDGGRGLWLRGDGGGQLSPLTAEESGVAVYGEQRGAALGDFNEDGRVDLVVSQNGASTCLYENVGARPGMRVRLQGPRGNPLGIGAIIRLHFGQRMGPAREVHAGAGYWSVDSAVQVLGCPWEPDSIHVAWPGGSAFVSAIPAGARSVTVDDHGNIRSDSIVSP